MFHFIVKEQFNQPFVLKKKLKNEIKPDHSITIARKSKSQHNLFV